MIKIYLRVKYRFESKYQLFTNGRKKVGMKKLKIQKPLLILYKQLMFMKIQKIIIQLKKEVLIVLGDMTADMESNKKLSPIVTESFFRGRKLNISLAFTSQSILKRLKQ